MSDTSEPAVVVGYQRLNDFIVSVLEAFKMPSETARLTADLMVRTDLRGVDSHGIGMLPRYVEHILGGFIVPGAEPVIVRDQLATALVDGQKALGHYPAAVAMRLAITKARTYGLGAVAVRNSNHYGAAANYSMMALQHNLIGISTTNSPYVAMVPTFGRAPMLSTNPISVAAPAGSHAPFVLDMATTTVAVGKLSIAARWGKPLPTGWATAESGEPEHDAPRALKARLLSPLGGTRELGSHKGYGLGVLVDILSGLLAGAVYGNLFQRTSMAERQHHDVGHFMAAIDPSRFRPLDEFKRDMDEMFQALKSSPPAEGQQRVYVAGEPEAETEERRRVEGIPLAPALVRQVNAIATSLRVPPLT